MLKTMRIKSEKVPDDYVKLVKESGFDALDLDWLRQGISNGRPAQDTYKEMQEHKLALGYVHLDGEPLERFWQEEIGVYNYYKRAISDIAGMVRSQGGMVKGQRDVNVIFNLDSIKTVKMEKSAKCIRQLGLLSEQAEVYGLTFCLENAIDSEFLIHFFKNNPWANLCIDTGHVNVFDKENLIYSNPQVFKGRIKATHIHDNRGDIDSHGLPFTGNVDWERFLKFLIACEYDGPLSLELCNHKYDEEQEKDYLFLISEGQKRLKYLQLMHCLLSKSIIG